MQTQPDHYINEDKGWNTATIHTPACTRMGKRRKLSRNGSWHESYGGRAAARQRAQATGRKNIMECSYCC